MFIMFYVYITQFFLSSRINKSSFTEKKMSRKIQSKLLLLKHIQPQTIKISAMPTHPRFLILQVKKQQKFIGAPVLRLLTSRNKAKCQSLLASDCVPNVFGCACALAKPPAKSIPDDASESPKTFKK